MSRPLRLGYLVPQFPGQTHIFFWRELAALKDMGAEPVLLSTLPPPPGLVSHEWSGEAATQTTYLVRRDASSVLDAISGFPLLTLYRALRSEPAAFVKDLLAAVPAARMLLRTARKLELDHVHVHSCGRAAIVAALAFLMGGPRYSLTLHGPLKVATVSGSNGAMLRLQQSSRRSCLTRYPRLWMERYLRRSPFRQWVSIRIAFRAATHHGFRRCPASRSDYSPADGLTA